MLVATAGHIDHGKTALVRALTGVETDRLPEEKSRGISIDLGFAYWRPEGGDTIGFVDVPGHERFVRNMLAGVSAVDAALLVVAADDGVMPQTVEHLQILDLLCIDRGVVAVTKADAVDPDRIAAVSSDARALLGGTALAGAPIMPVSAMSGAGIEPLANALQALGSRFRRDPADHHFRLAIDRVFSVTGVGTVVTGTVLDGTLHPGARLVVSPLGIEVRVRGLQRAGEKVERVAAGERCAISLAGVELSDVHRGDWLVAPSMHAPTVRLEARLRVLPTRDEPLKHYTPVHLHLGTADLTARVLIPGAGAIPPGGDAIVQLVLDQRTAASTGDRLVLRDQAGRQSIGGGRVLDPFASADRRRQAGRAPIALAMEATDAAAALQALLAIDGYEVDVERFERSFDLIPEAAQALYRQAGAVLLGRHRTVALSTAHVEGLDREIEIRLADHHREHPEVAGLTARELRAGLTIPPSAEAFSTLLRELTERHLVVQDGALVRLPGHRASFSATETVQWDRLLGWLEERGIVPFSEAELLRELRTSEAAVRSLLYRRRASGDLWRITPTRYLLRDQVAALAARAAVVAADTGEEGFSAALFRDAIGTGRTWAIHILEFFDEIGVTRRRGNLRFIRADFDQVVGVAPPYSPHGGPIQLGGA